MFEFDFDPEAARVSAIEFFKKMVKEDAERVAESWKNGINEWAIRHANLMMVDHYVKYYGADKEELRNFIENEYAKIVL